MPTLPEATDLGARPSLNTGRLDKPSGANVGLADAAVDAAKHFKAVMDEKREKEHQLNYALARNEMQQLDLEEREKLVDDLDWATQVERYASGFASGAETISGRYKLSPSDRQILESETNLIAAQGQIQVAGRSRVLEVKEAMGNYIEGKARAKANILIADPGARNRIVLGQLDAIDAMVRAGFMDEDEAAIEREEMTQDFALSSLLAMPAGVRWPAIRKSLAYRRGSSASLGEYADAFTRAAEATGLPVELLHAVGARESSLDPSKVNVDSGAAGLMQLMEGTAVDLGVTDRMDAEQSIRGGAQYLAEQFERFGDPDKALAAYNWGPQNVVDAMAEHGTDWLSHAPEETRKYVAALTDIWASGGSGKELATNTGVGPLTADDIRNGLGTDSVADFVHTDTLAKMSEAAYKEDKTNRQRIASQAVANAAFDIFPEDKAAQDKHIRDNSNGTVEKMALEDARIRQTGEKAAMLESSRARMEDLSDQMRDEGLLFKDIPNDEMPELLAHENILKERSRLLSYGKQFPDITVRTRPRIPETGMSQQGWNEMPAYGKGSRSEANLETAEYYNAFTEIDHDKMVIEQKNLRAAEGELILTGDLTPGVMVSKALDAMQFTVTSDSDDEKLDGIKARLEAELRQRILQQQNATTPRQELDEQAKNKILADLLSPMAFVEDTEPWYTFFGMGSDERKRVHLMTTAETEAAYVNMDRANLETMMYKGQELTVQKILEKMAAEARPSILEITPHNLSRAAFAFLNNIGTTPAEERDEVLRRLRGD